MIKSDVLLKFSDSNPERDAARQQEYGHAGSYYDKLAVTEALRTEKREE